MAKQLFRIPDISKIRVTDPLFGHYAELAATKILPYQWAVLNNEAPDAEPTYCIQNFRIAAGEAEGERKGVIFQDSDLYKWLEAVAYCISAGKGAEFEEIADEAIELIGRAQQDDGYLNTYFTVLAPEKRWQNLVEGHELYCSGHFIEAAVAYYKATGKEKVLDIARRNADLICRTFGTKEGQLRGYPGHQEIELALVKLYRVTGDEKYLECARYFLDERGREPNYFTAEIARRGDSHFSELSNYDLAYSQSHCRPAEQRDADGHAVRLMYMCSAMADVAVECDDAELMNAAQALWESATGRRMYLTGGIGSSGFRERFTTDYDLPNESSYCESCASIGLMMFGQRMAAATGEAGYYDAVERALYNTVLAGISVSGDRYFYVNPLEVVPCNCTDHTSMRHVKAERQGWFSVACCPPNIVRTLTSLGQYIYAEGDGCTAINQFITSAAVLHNGDFAVSMDSKLMQTGLVSIRVDCAGAEPHILKIRLPWYAGKAKIKLNGKKISPAEEKGYLVIARRWAEGDTLELNLDVKPRWVMADPNVRQDLGKIALMKGPCVYCLEEADNALPLGAVYVTEKAKLCERKSDERLPGELPMIEYDGFRASFGESGQLYGDPEYSLAPTKLYAVPYCLWNNRGCGEMAVWQKLKV